MNHCSGSWSASRSVRQKYGSEGPHPDQVRIRIRTKMHRSATLVSSLLSSSCFLSSQSLSLQRDLLRVRVCQNGTVCRVRLKIVWMSKASRPATGDIWVPALPKQWRSQPAMKRNERDETVRDIPLMDQLDRWELPHKIKDSRVPPRRHLNPGLPGFH